MMSGILIAKGMLFFQDFQLWKQEEALKAHKYGLF